MTRQRLSLFIYTERSEPYKTQVLFIGSTTEVKIKIIQFIHTYTYIHTQIYFKHGKKPSVHQKDCYLQVCKP